MYFDGAKFAAIGSDGKLSPVKEVTAGGQDYKGFVALENGHFLVLGDQFPMVVIDIREDGEIAWRRTFSRNWVLPSAATLDGGSSCIVSSDYNRPLLHLTWLDAAGTVRHTEQFSGANSIAASKNNMCTLLYSRRSTRYQSEYFLTSFDTTFNRVWTIRVLDSAPSGAQFNLAAVADGYIVAIDSTDGLLLVKYSTAGRLLWSATDRSRRSVRFVVPSGDSYYLVGAGPKNQHSLHVIRAR